MKNSRRGFIAKTGLAILGYFSLPSPFYSISADNGNTRYLYGRLLDLFGYPVPDCTVELIKNYSLNLEYTDISGQSVIPGKSIKTNASGNFQFEFDPDNYKPFNDLGLRFTVNLQPLLINSFEFTNTNIPFPVQEVYSSNGGKWVNDILPKTVNTKRINFYVDTSRNLIRQYIISTGLVQRLTNLEELSHSDGGTANYSYYPNHSDPDDPGECLDESDAEVWFKHCRHWHYPEIINKNRKIVIPWGKTDRRVIPFVVCEGKLYFVDAQTGEDFDRTFRMIVNPAYKHITNPINPLEYCNQEQVDGEMCIWFMGNKNGGPLTPGFTNIKRSQNSADLADMFQLTTTNETCRAYVYDKKPGIFGTILKDTCSKVPVRKEAECNTTRTWMLGTWLADTSHAHGGDHFNEIHPVYWIVPFFGSWERFHLFQYYFMSDFVIRPDYFNRFKTEALLQNLEEFVTALIASDKKAYSKYVTHLHQYGLDLLQSEEKTAGIDVLSSIKIETIDYWAQNQSIATLKNILKKKLQKVFDLLTNLGSGFLLYPGMFYCYEMIETARVRNSSSSIDVKMYVQDALSRSNNYINLITLKNDMINSYNLCFDELYVGMRNNPNTIAEFYARSSMRYITQGLFIREFVYDEPANSNKYEDHYNLALQKLNTGTVQPLKELMSKRIENFWHDAIPFARESS